MTSIAAPVENNNFNSEFEAYRRACREKYQQQQVPATVEEKEEEEAVANVEEDSIADNAISNSETSVPTTSTTTTTFSSPASPQLSSSTSALGASTELRSSSNSLNSSSGEVRLNSSVENIRKEKSVQRRGSLDKVMSFFSKKPDSPEVAREKAKLRAEREKQEQDNRMAYFIAKLQMEGRSDEEIQMHLFHIRDQSQFRRPRSNSIGEFFKSMSLAFKDELSVRRDRNAVTLNVSTETPFYAAPPPSFANDTGYTYEELVALENVPRGVNSLEHLPILVFSGQSLPSSQSTCAVCMTDFEHEEELRALSCTHHFHKECIDKWLSVGTTCPVCKGDVRCEHPAE